jgi:NAD-dependent DNA ligase
MPYVSRVECEHNRNNPNPIIEFPSTCPICGSKLSISDSGKSAICLNMACAGRSIQRITNMFSKLNIKGFADATFNILKDFDHLYKFYTNDYKVDRDFYINKLGVADGNSFSDALLSLQQDVWKDYIIMGALGFNSIAHKKWQDILSNIKLVDLYNICKGKSNNAIYDILKANIKNIGEITAITISNEWSFFEKDIEFIINNIKLLDSSNMAESKGQIRFTGFRNSHLMELLSTAGFDAGEGSVTKKTDILLIPFQGYSSSKVLKAMNNPRTKIIPIDEFMKDSIKYIGIELS